MWRIGARKGASQRRRKTYSSVWAPPHFLQVELLHAFLIGGDGRALDTDMVLQDGIGCVDGNLVVGLRNEDLRKESRKKRRWASDNKRSGMANTMGQDTHLISVF